MNMSTHPPDIPDVSLAVFITEWQQAGFSKTKMASMLGVSRPTLDRLLADSHCSVSKFDNISDQEIDEITQQAINSLPMMGERMVIGFFRTKGKRVQRWRIRKSLKRVDGVGVMLRRDRASRIIQRRRYGSPHPHFVWHVDGNHKLSRWKLYIHCAIDGYSRLCIFMKCGRSNTSRAVLLLFNQAVLEEKVLPLKVRTDYGSENVLVLQSMLALRGETSVLTGSSVHNQRIERFNRDINTNIRLKYAPQFYALENEGVLDVESQLDVAILHIIYLDALNEDLTNLKHAHNHHPVRTMNNESPFQVAVSSELPDEIIIDPNRPVQLMNATEPEGGNQDMYYHVNQLLRQHPIEEPTSVPDDFIGQYKELREHVLNLVNL